MNATLELTNIGFGNECLDLVIRGTDAEYRAARERLRYKAYEIPGEGTAYLAESSDNWMASFLFHNPLNESGYCGAMFDLQMESGQNHVIRGPWSSSASSITRLVKEFGRKVNIIEAVFIDERGYRTGIAVNLDMVEPMFHTSGSCSIRKVLDRHDRMKMEKAMH